MGPQNHLTYRPPAVTEPPAPRLFVRARSRNALQIRENLAAGELEAMLRREARARERQLALRLYLTFFTWGGFRRLLHYVVGSVVTIPILNFVFTPLGLKDWKIQVLLAAGFGVVMALGRPRGGTVGFLLATTGFLTLAFCGYVGNLEDALHVVLALLVYFGLGLALGISENVVRQGE